LQYNSLTPMKLDRLLFVGMLALLLGSVASYFAARSRLWFFVAAHPWEFTAISALAALAAAAFQLQETRSGIERTKRLRVIATKEAELARAAILRVPHHGTREDDEWLRLIAETSTVNVSASTVNADQSLAELRAQLGTLTRQVKEHQNEIVEVHKVDPVLEATLKASIENLTRRIETLEKRQLEKWDVALVFIQLLGAIGVFFGIVFGILKYLYG